MEDIWCRVGWLEGGRGGGSETPSQPLIDPDVYSKDLVSMHTDQVGRMYICVYVF